MDRHHDLEAAHVGLQDLGDGDAAVGLQMILEECDEHTRRSHAGVVQSGGQIGPVSYTHLSVCSPIQPSVKVMFSSGTMRR